MELFAANGYEQTTAADIAASVGLTERTFFRHFADKREVLFYGQQEMADAVLAGINDAPAMQIVAGALRSGARFFADERRPHARTRQSVIDQNQPLREREQHKLADLASQVAEALLAKASQSPRRR